MGSLIKRPRVRILAFSGCLVAGPFSEQYVAPVGAHEEK
jgi:hypothetical protein